MDVVVPIELPGPQFNAFKILAPQRKAFRKRRPLIRNLRLFANQGNRFLVALCAQQSRGLNPGLSGANDDRAFCHYRCLLGKRTIRPSSSSVTLIWQLRRLVGRRSSAEISSTASSVSCAGGRRSKNFSSTKTWHVEHMQTPPHSATMPSMPFFSAAAITVVPTGTSTSRASPLEET